MFSILILVLALSMDAFVASIAYGVNRVFVSWEKILLMNAICSGSLLLALEAGTLLDGILPDGLPRRICVVCLFLLGVIKLLDYSIKKYIRGRKSLHRNLAFSFSGISVIINIYGDPMEADWDHSKSLSWKETVFLSLAMSIDGLAAGVLAAFLETPVWISAITSLILGTAMTAIGLLLGRKLSDRVRCDLSWLSGLLFLILSLIKG